MKKQLRSKCQSCEKELTRLDVKFCNNVCHMTSVYKEYIKRWKAGLETGISGKTGISQHLRRYLFEKHDSKCQECGWNKRNVKTNKIPLTVEHVDGNWANNKEENLKLLCPNCHSLTPTYGALNKGSGRTQRYAALA